MSNRSWGRAFTPSARFTAMKGRGDDDRPDRADGAEPENDGGQEGEDQTRRGHGVEHPVPKNPSHHRYPIRIPKTDPRTKAMEKPMKIRRRAEMFGQNARGHDLPHLLEDVQRGGENEVADQVSRRQSPSPKKNEPATREVSRSKAPKAACRWPADLEPAGLVVLIGLHPGVDVIAVSPLPVAGFRTRSAGNGQAESFLNPVLINMSRRT